MDVKDIPLWAWREVDKRVRDRHPTSTIGWAEYDDGMRTLAAGLIAKYEDQPVDPLLIEAREIVASWLEAHPDKQTKKWTPGAFRDGTNDNDLSVQQALAAIKRGIEIGKEGK